MISVPILAVLKLPPPGVKPYKPPNLGDSMSGPTVINLGAVLFIAGLKLIRNSVVDPNAITLSTLLSMTKESSTSKIVSYA